MAARTSELLTSRSTAWESVRRRAPRTTQACEPAIAEHRRAAEAAPDPLGSPVVGPQPGQEQHERDAGERGGGGAEIPQRDPRRESAGLRPRPPRRSRWRSRGSYRITRHSVSPKSPASSAAMAVRAAMERPPTSAQPAALRTLSRGSLTAVISAVEGPTGGIPSSGQRQSREGAQGGARVRRGRGGHERLALALGQAERVGVPRVELAQIAARALRAEVVLGARR